MRDLRLPINSSILLIEDGVYGALQNTSFESSITNAQKRNFGSKVQSKEYPSSEMQTYTTQMQIIYKTIARLCAYPSRVQSIVRLQDSTPRE